MNPKLILSFCLIGISLFSLAYDIPEDTLKKEMVYDMPDRMPQYPGGADAMDVFIQANITYPPEAKSQMIKGKVYVQFIVEKDGSISDIQVRRGAHPTLDGEAMRVVSLMPNWTPGSMRGKKVRVRYTLPITFSLT